MSENKKNEIIGDLYALRAGLSLSAQISENIIVKEKGFNESLSGLVSETRLSADELTQYIQAPKYSNADEFCYEKSDSLAQVEWFGSDEFLEKANTWHNECKSNLIKECSRKIEECKRCKKREIRKIIFCIPLCLLSIPLTEILIGVFFLLRLCIFKSEKYSNYKSYKKEQVYNQKILDNLETAPQYFERIFSGCDEYSVALYIKSKYLLDISPSLNKKSKLIIEKRKK